MVWFSLCDSVYMYTQLDGANVEPQVGCCCQVIPGWGNLYEKGMVSDTTSVMFIVIVLFLAPASRPDFSSTEMTPKVHLRRKQWQLMLFLGRFWSGVTWPNYRGGLCCCLAVGLPWQMPSRLCCPSADVFYNTG